MVKINIKFFAKAKELLTKELTHSNDFLELSFEQPISVSELRNFLIGKLSFKKDREAIELLINDCAIGNSQQILSNQDVISESQNLVLLPPVCGG